MILNIVERTAMETAGPCGKDGGVDKLVMTWGRSVDADALERIR